MIRRSSLFPLLVAGLLAVLLLPAPGPRPAAAQAKLNVAATVAPIANLVLNVGGNRINLAQIVPSGVDSHTFEPTPSNARVLAEADLVVVNGLHLEESTLQLAEANKKSGATILLLGENTITRAEWVFDFSFPAEAGDPNPHLWMNPVYAMRYAELVRDALVSLDPASADYYRDNTIRFLARGAEVDTAIAATVQAIPEGNRKLLTFHDSFAYFAPRYGMTVIGAIQPADFSEPSPREVAALIEQIKAEGVPAIFGSEVFPSRVLEQIGREAGVRYVDTLRDDDLPGSPGESRHTYFGMMLENVKTMAEALGGDPTPVTTVDPSNTYLP